MLRMNAGRLAERWIEVSEDQGFGDDRPQDGGLEADEVR